MRLGLFLLTITFNISIFAQESEAYVKYKKNLNYWEGYVVDKKGEKIWGLVKQQNDDKLSYRVVFVAKDGKKKTFKPSQIQGYGFLVHNYVSDQKHFLEIISEGKRVGVYKAIIVFRGMVSTGMAVANEVELYYFKKVGQSNFQSFERARFKKEISSYFSDCESLKNKILSEELTHKDFNKIAYHYNYDCK